MPLYLYNFFHLNLAYSAIEEEDRPQVIERCYWPLLSLARRRDLPFGIELSGYTLERIAAIDPDWVAELRALVHDGPCELIGCGYAQVIGPLVPHQVSAANLRVGQTVYEQLLGRRPTLALLNEQAFSSGILPLYQEAGFEGVIMEWNNPARDHPHWDPEWRYFPQRALAANGSSMPLVWNKSISFQKFQRYAHGELDLQEMLTYVRSHLPTEENRAFPLYGNDVEVFDFRPGRYMTEEPIQAEGEWERIGALYQALSEEPMMEWISPSNVMEVLASRNACHELDLATAGQPIPVKKQDKYNPVRWAVSGRDDLRINTSCWRILRALELCEYASEEEWKELCYLWSSDFRTHLTAARWQAYEGKLQATLERHEVAQPKSEESYEKKTDRPELRRKHAVRWFKEKDGRYLRIIGDRMEVRLNLRRGLALDFLVDRKVSEQPAVGTLHHGYFDDIRWGADFYSGHLVFEAPGRPKVADLNPVVPEIEETKIGLRIGAAIPTALGIVRKEWELMDRSGVLTQSIRLHWKEEVMGSLRFGNITLLPRFLKPAALRFCSHNGGRECEEFLLGNDPVDHGRAVSFLISANQGLGMTEGTMEFTDHRFSLEIARDPAQAATLGLVSHYRIPPTHFSRLTLSALEMDDTCKPRSLEGLELGFEIRVKAKCGVESGEADY